MFAEARAIYPLDEKRKEKIAFNCVVPKENIISAPDGGTMRLGDWKCEIKKGTIAFRAYGKKFNF